MGALVVGIWGSGSLGGGSFSGRYAGIKGGSLSGRKVGSLDGETRSCEVQRKPEIIAFLLDLCYFKLRKQIRVLASLALLTLNQTHLIYQRSKWQMRAVIHIVWNKGCMQQTTAFCVSIQISIISHVEFIICSTAFCAWSVIEICAIGRHDTADMITMIVSIKTLEYQLVKLTWMKYIDLQKFEGGVHSVMKSYPTDPFMANPFHMLQVRLGLHTIYCYSQNLTVIIISEVICCAK